MSLVVVGILVTVQLTSIRKWIIKLKVQQIDYMSSEVQCATLAIHPRAPHTIIQQWARAEDEQ